MSETEKQLHNRIAKLENGLQILKSRVPMYFGIAKSKFVKDYIERVLRDK